MEEISFSKFFKSVRADFGNKEAWKIKAIYFFLLFGIVMIWAQVTVHQATLNLTLEDISQMVAVGSVSAIIIPFLSGLVADKIGNFSRLLCVLTFLLSLCSILFAFIPSIETHECIVPDTESVGGKSNTTKYASNASSLIDSGSEIHPLKNDQNLFEVEYNGNASVPFYGGSKGDPDAYLHSLISRRKEDMWACVDQAANGTLQREPGSHAFTYWSYMIIRTSYFVLLGSTYTLFDSSVVAMSKEGLMDYGLQRAWGTLAAIPSGFIGGLLVDAFSTSPGEKDFSIMFYVSGLCCGLSGVCMFFVSISFKLPATKLTLDVLHELKKVETLILLVFSLLKGISMAYAETFMYLFMSGLGATQTLIGLTVSVGGIIEIFLQMVATPLCKLLGRPTVLFIGMLSYAIRFFGFSYIYNPVWVLPLEAIDSWSGLTSTAIYMSTAAICAPSTVATFRGIIESLHSGVGRIFSSNVGLVLNETFGSRTSWVIMASFALCSSVIYVVSILSLKLFQNWRRRRSDNFHVEAKNDSQSASRENNIPQSYQGVENAAFRH